MKTPHVARASLAMTLSVATLLTGCSWRGLTSLPLPGATGRGEGATVFHVQIPNVGTLESNSPVMIDDVIVGSVGKMTVQGWHADVELFVKPNVVVPANVVVTIGQTSLLGSSHLALNPPAGVAPAGRLTSGVTVPLSKASTYPSTEQTLASLSAVINGGGLGQIGPIVRSFNAAFAGHQDSIRDLITRLGTFVGVFDDQRDDVISIAQQLNRLAATFAGQRDILTDALQKLPPALEVLLRERPRLTTALDRLRTFSETTTALISEAQTDLVEDLRHLEPTLRALAEVGANLTPALQYTSAMPYGQAPLDRYAKGDFLNLSATFDITVPRLKRELLMGTRWGDPTQEIQAAIGDPGYTQQTRDPLGVGVAPPPAVIPPKPAETPPPPLAGLAETPPEPPNPVEPGVSAPAAGTTPPNAGG
jgi:phospholipid/cholesterol/gamma-HCH transport system substrate-binding protein